jgi:hypothetical protein
VEILTGDPLELLVGQIAVAVDATGTPVPPQGEDRTEAA